MREIQEERGRWRHNHEGGGVLSVEKGCQLRPIAEKVRLLGAHIANGHYYEYQIINHLLVGLST